MVWSGKITRVRAVYIGLALVVMAIFHHTFYSHGISAKQDDVHKESKFEARERKESIDTALATATTQDARDYFTVIGNENLLNSSQSQSSRNILNSVLPTTCPLNWNPVGLDVQSYETSWSEHAKSNTKGAFKTIENPEIKLNPDRFLLPILVWGPNNQLVGLWESTFLAVMLNRTLVIPSFEKHFTDTQWKRRQLNRIAPLHRIDIRDLCGFVSCVTIEEFQRNCHSQVDGILNTKYLTTSKIRSIESSIGMKILPKDAKDNIIATVLIPRNGTSGQKKTLTFNSDRAQMLFDSPARCVIYPYPFWDVFTKDMKTTLYQKVVNNLRQGANPPPTEEIMESIMRHCRRPDYIREISQDFITHAMKDQPFLSVHWRYGRRDFMRDRHCKKTERTKNLCVAARKFDSHSFANRIEEKILSLRNQKNIMIKHIYIASPLSESDMITRVSVLLSKRGLFVSSSAQLIAFIRVRYRHCDFLTKHFEDIISSTEMELCTKGFSFLSSLGTSWSGNVWISRLLSEDAQIDLTPDPIFKV